MLRKTASHALRRFLSFAPRFGLVPPPSRPDGLSALVRVHNERDWLEESIASVAPFVEEIVAVDNGSIDGSKELLDGLAARLPNLKVFSFPSRLPWEYSNFCLKQTTRKWVIKWDADFVAIEMGMRRLRENLRALDPLRHYYISPTLVELAGDFKHQFPSCRIRRDIELFTFSPRLAYVPVTRTIPADPVRLRLPARFLGTEYSIRFEALSLPLYFDKLVFSEPAAFHINVKPARRILDGFFYLQWLREENLCAFTHLDDFIRDRIAAWGAVSIEEAARMYVDEYVKTLAPYDDRIMELPANVRALAASSPYRVIYEGGKITGRNDGTRAEAVR